MESIQLQKGVGTSSSTDSLKHHRCQLLFTPSLSHIRCKEVGIDAKGAPNLDHESQKTVSTDEKRSWCGVALISRLLQIIGLFRKRAL